MCLLKIDGICTLVRQNPRGDFVLRRSMGNQSGRRPSRSSSEGRSPGKSVAPRVIFCRVLRCSAQRAKSLPDCPSREDWRTVRVGVKMNCWPVGPNVTGNKKGLWNGRCTRASPFAGRTDAPLGLTSAATGADRNGLRALSQRQQTLAAHTECACYLGIGRLAVKAHPMAESRNSTNSNLPGARGKGDRLLLPERPCGCCAYETAVSLFPRRARG